MPSASTRSSTDSEYVVDVEVENCGLDTESEYARDLFVVPVLCEIREAASARDAAQESDVRLGRVMEEQQDRRNSCDDDTLQNAE